MGGAVVRTQGDGVVRTQGGGVVKTQSGGVISAQRTRCGGAIEVKRWLGCWGGRAAKVQGWLNAWVARAQGWWYVKFNLYEPSPY